jgi:hypothetical protein
MTLFDQVGFMYRAPHAWEQSGDSATAVWQLFSTSMMPLCLAGQGYIQSDSCTEELLWAIVSTESKRNYSCGAYDGGLGPGCSN